MGRPRFVPLPALCFLKPCFVAQSFVAQGFLAQGAAEAVGQVGTAEWGRCGGRGIQLGKPG